MTLLEGSYLSLIQHPMSRGHLILLPLVEQLVLQVAQRVAGSSGTVRAGVEATEGCSSVGSTGRSESGNTTDILLSLGH